MTKAEIQLLICICHLEILRYDLNANMILIRQLDRIANRHVVGDIALKCFEELSILRSHCYKTQGICDMVEHTLLNTSGGKERLDDLNNRMPKPRL